MNSGRHRLPVLAALAACATILGGCGARETPVEKATREGILLVGNGADPASLDPQLITGLSDSRPVMALFEGLTSPDPSTLQPRPAVAQSWEYDEKTLTWTFHLRPEARWSNGDPVTAHDFVFSYQRILTPSVGAEYANMLYPIKNARDFNQGKLKDFSQVGVKAVDDRTLQIQLEHPVGYFLSLLFHQTYFPLHPPTIKKFDATLRHDGSWAKAGSLVGNGPFTLTKYVLGEVIEVKKNPQYWDVARVRLNGIRFYPISDLNAEERAFRNGILHLTSTLPPQKVPFYRESKSPYLRIMPVYGTYYYMLNVRKPPLNDVRVRLALNMAIDRQTIVDKVVRGGQAPAYSLVPPDAQYKSRTQIKEDIEAAKKLLAEAGYPDGKGMEPIELLYNTSVGHQAIAEALQQRWRETLGANIQLANLSWPAYLERRRSQDFEMLRASWYGDYLDPSTFLDLFKSDNPMEQTGWRNPQYDEWMAKAAVELDPAKRMDDFQQAEAILLKEVPFIPLYYYTTIILIRPEVHGYDNNLLDQHPYSDVYLEPAAKK